MYKHLVNYGYDVTVLMCRPRQETSVGSLGKEGWLHETALQKGAVGFLLNNIEGLKFALSRKPDVVVVTSLFWLAGTFLRLLTRAKVVVDVRSIPVETSTVKQKLEEAMFYAMMLIPIWHGASYISKETRQFLESRSRTLKSIPGVVWKSGVEITLAKRGYGAELRKA